MRVLVFGASGYVGSNLVPALRHHSAALAVRAASRNRDVLEARMWSDVEVVAADALVPESLLAALESVDVAYYLVHSMASGKGFDRRDISAASNFARAAQQAGVRRIVYLGGLIPLASKSAHLLSRAATGDALRQGSVPVIELRAGIIVGPGSAAFEVMRDLVNHLPVMVTPRWVQSRSSPIALHNLLHYLVELGLGDKVPRGIFDVGGADVLSYEAMMQAYARKAGKRIRILPVPLLSPHLSSLWLKLVTSVPTAVGKALIEGLEHDFVANDKAIRALIPQCLMGFDEALEEVARAEQNNTVPARWVEGAFPLRDYNPDYSFYAKQAGGEAYADASQAACWRIIEGIGGQRGYFYLDGLWRLREILDWCVGGCGLHRQRRHPDRLRLGDRVDSWRVMGLERGQRLTLKFGMKAPGAGVLEFTLSPEGNGTRIDATAYWHPAGVWGLLYWYSLVPVHLVIFRGLTAAIARRAQELER